MQQLLLPVEATRLGAYEFIENLSQKKKFLIMLKEPKSFELKKERI